MPRNLACDGHGRVARTAGGDESRCLGLLMYFFILFFEVRVVLKSTVHLARCKINSAVGCEEEAGQTKKVTSAHGDRDRVAG